MGNLSQAMQNLVSDIQASTKARKTSLQDLFSSLRKKLSEEERNRLETTRKFLDHLFDDNRQLFSSLKRTLSTAKQVRVSAARGLLKEILKHNHDVASQLRKEFAREEKSRVSSNQKLLKGFESRRTELADEQKRLLVSLKEDIAQCRKNRLKKQEELMDTISALYKAMEADLLEKMAENQGERSANEQNRLITTRKFLNDVRLVIGNQRSDVNELFESFRAEREETIIADLKLSREIWKGISEKRQRVPESREPSGEPEEGNIPGHAGFGATFFQRNP